MLITGSYGLRRDLHVCAAPMAIIFTMGAILSLNVVTNAADGIFSLLCAQISKIAENYWSKSNVSFLPCSALCIALEMPII